MNPKKAKFLIAGVVIVGAFLYLGISGFQGDNLVYFLTVDEIAAKRASLDGQGIRVQGKIVPKSFSRRPDEMLISFHIQGEKTTLPVSFRGVPPDLLENGFPVIAEGKLDGDGVLKAKNLMVACPSKFEEMQKAGEAVPVNHDAMVQESAQAKRAERN